MEFGRELSTKSYIILRCFLSVGGIAKEQQQADVKFIMKLKEE
jgi:hypothetical protein